MSFWLEEMQQWWDSGTLPPCLIISGDIGSGKTVLAAQFVDTVSPTLAGAPHDALKALMSFPALRTACLSQLETTLQRRLDQLRPPPPK